MYSSALLSLQRPLYSNFHRTRQFNFAKRVLPKLLAVVSFHLVVCRAPPLQGGLPAAFALTLCISLAPQASLVLPWIDLSAFQNTEGKPRQEIDWPCLVNLTIDDFLAGYTKFSSQVYLSALKNNSDKNLNNHKSQALPNMPLLDSRV